MKLQIGLRMIDQRIGEQEIKMQAVIYSNGSQECERMTSLLKSLGDDFHEYVLDVDFDDNAFEQNLDQMQHILRLQSDIITLVV